MPLQSRPITAMWANMELGLAGWMASSWPILDSKRPAGAPSVFVSSTPCCTATCPSLGYESQMMHANAANDGRAAFESPLSVGSLPNKVKRERRDAQASCASHPMQSSTGSPTTDRDKLRRMVYAETTAV